MKKFLLPAILALAGLGFILVPNLFSSGSIDLKIQPASVIMPAAYKVYANPDVAGGRYNLFKAVVKNTGSSEIHNFKVQFRVPKYIDDWTDVSAPKDILPGQEAVITCFPVFDQSITQKSTSSREKAEIRFLYGSKANPTERDESFNFNMTSVNDIVYNDMNDSEKVYGNDLFTNMPLYACMVTSEDPIIKYYAQQVQQKVLQGEQAAGVGTGGGITDAKIKEIIRVMEGVYDATRLTKMVYSETSGGVSTFGDATATTEHIRLPREVVTGNTGLCIELALLHASVLEAAGNHAVIFLIPGHAFPGVKVGDNGYMAIEATGIGGQGLGGVASAQQAFAAGEAEMDTFFMMRNKGMPGYFLLDIDGLNDEGYKQMEMKDDQYLRAKVDQLAQSFTGGGMEYNQPQQQQGQEQGGGGDETTVDNNTPSNSNNTTAMETYRGLISFQYPASWQRRNRPVPQVPILTTMFTSPGGRHGAVEIYQVPGAASASQALAYIQQTLAKYGVQVRYQGDGEQNGLTRVAGISQDKTGNYRWEGFLKVVNGGVEAVVVGAGRNASFTAIHQQIMNTIQ
ncbi:MAG TPA: hypothetical protein VG847_07615 [Chitinophagaceae bacterium]|nr:hypothetical protein [Chitinophagaceae bacterium]